MRIQVSLISFAFLVGCAVKPLPSVAPVRVAPIAPSAGEARTTDPLILVTDGSGTMYQAAAFPAAKALTQSLASSLPERNVRAQRGSSYDAGLIGFGGADRISVPLAPFDRAALASHGLSASRLTSRGYGESQPIATNETEEGRAQNRRVELTPLP